MPALRLQRASVREIRRPEGKPYGEGREKGGVVGGGGPRAMVVPQLEAELRPARSRNHRGAGASAAVRGEDRDVVGEGKHPLAERLVRGTRELLLQLGP